MVLLGLGIIFLALFYQNHFFKMKSRESDLLLKTSLESEKKERERIASDLHDGVSGDLNSIRNYLFILHKGEKDLKRQELFAEIRKGVEAALESTRQVSYNLMPPLLDVLGFIAALKDYFEGLSKNSAIAFNVIYEPELPELSSAMRYELFRVIQELTTNMIKYGDINNCTVTVSCCDGIFNLQIVDDGLPFDFKESLANSKGLGLRNISSRLKSINAELIQRPVHKGNQFSCTIKTQS